MGKWNYRRRWTPKNYYRDQRLPSPPTYYDTEFKLRGAWKNVELPWEERFCISVGIPWEKVVTAKKCMQCHDNVVNWNDSAGEVTFNDAKKRFWAKINEIPSESDAPQPDPDMYIGEIDWNPEIDPELVKDLDKSYFNPDETEKVENFHDTKQKGDGCILGLDDKNASSSHDPWGRDKNAILNNKTSVNKNISDPWERAKTQFVRETKEVAWADNSRDRNATWGGDITWRGVARDSWHWNQINRGQRGRQRGRCRDTFLGREQWHAQHDVPQRHNGSGWDRKRQGAQQYTSSYKSARVQSDDHGEGNQWTTHSRRD